jgi:hypothetical protein
LAFSIFDFQRRRISIKQKNVIQIDAPVSDEKTRERTVAVIVNSNFIFDARRVR